MKHMFFTLLITMIIITSTAQAEIQLKYGMVASDTSEQSPVAWAGLWAETDNCTNCIALFAVETYIDNIEEPGDRLVGVDYVMKWFEKPHAVIRTNFGFAVADEGLQGAEVFNFHFGSGMTVKKCIYKMSCSLNYDHFSNGRTLFNRDHIAINKPLDLVSIGIGF